MNSCSDSKSQQALVESFIRWLCLVDLWLNRPDLWHLGSRNGRQSRCAGAGKSRNARFVWASKLGPLDLQGQGTGAGSGRSLISAGAKTGRSPRSAGAGEGGSPRSAGAGEGGFPISAGTGEGGSPRSFVIEGVSSRFAGTEEVHLDLERKEDPWGSV